RDDLRIADVRWYSKDGRLHHDIKPSKTIPQFCEAENLSAPSYFKIQRLGLGPDEMRVPGSEIVRIAATAHREWRERMAALSKTQQAELERQRRVAQRRAAGVASSRKRRSRPNQVAGTDNARPEN